MRSKPKAVLITGASQRLGADFVKESLRIGFRVVAHFRSSRQPLESWLHKNPLLRKRVYWLQSDLRSSPEELIEQACTLPVSIVGLVNNASEYTQGNLLDTQHFDSILAANSFAPLALARSFHRTIGAGWIINITDAHIYTITIKFQNYRFSKKILEELTHQLALLFAPHIRVNALAPGAMIPAKSIESKATFNVLRNSIPLKKTGDRMSLMHAYRFLIENTYITGQTIFVDGGWHLCP
jgi:pteridine reductase